MKKCPFCAEEIQDEAIKCKHCGEFLNQPPKAPWFCRTSMLILALCTVGPLALPLVWINPRFSLAVKTLISIAVILITWWIYILFMHTMADLKQSMHSLGLTI